MSLSKLQANKDQRINGGVITQNRKSQSQSIINGDGIKGSAKTKWKDHIY